MEGKDKMNLVLESVGENKVRVIRVLCDVTKMNIQEAREIVDKVLAGCPYIIENLSEEEMQSAVKKFTVAGANIIPPEGFVLKEEEESEVEKNTNKIIEKLDDIFAHIIEWHENLFHNNKTLAIILFIIEGLAIIALLYNYWETILAIVCLLALIAPFVFKKAYSDKDRKETKEMLKEIGIGIAKLVIIGVIVVVIIFVKTTGPVSVVRNSYFVNFSDEITIGEAFENVFSDCKWSKYSYNNNKYVRFTGDFTTDDGSNTSTYQINFLVLGDSCSIDSIYVNGIDSSEAEFLILTGIYVRNGVNQ